MAGIDLCDVLTEIYLCSVCSGQEILRRILAAVLTEVDLCDLCSGHEILRRGGGRGGGQVDLEEWTALWGQVRKVMAQA